MELQTFRQQCGDLEQKVANFIQEKEQFEKEVHVKWVFHFTQLYTTEQVRGDISDHRSTVQLQVQFAWSEDQRSLVIGRLMRMEWFLKELTHGISSMHKITFKLKKT